MPLPDALANILAVVGIGEFVEFRFRLEVAYPKADAPMLEAVAKYRDKPVLGDGVLECLVELALRLNGTRPLKPPPSHLLCAFDKIGERRDIKAHASGLDAFVAFVRGFCPAPRLGDKIGFDMFLKVFFRVAHCCTTFHVADVQRTYNRPFSFFMTRFRTEDSSSGTVIFNR